MNSGTCSSFPAFFSQIGATADDKPNSHLIVAMTSDKGLCGGVHSSVCKTIKAIMNEKNPDMEIKLFLVGDKANQMLTRYSVWCLCFTCRNRLIFEVFVLLEVLCYIYGTRIKISKFFCLNPVFVELCLQRYEGQIENCETKLIFSLCEHIIFILTFNTYMLQTLTYCRTKGTLC